MQLGIMIAEPIPERRVIAFDLALAYDIAYYDALYLELAQKLRLPLLTADRPFYDRIAPAFPTAIYLDDIG